VKTAGEWPRFGAFSYDFQRGQLDRLIEAFQRTGLTAVQLGQGLLDDAIDDPGRASDTRRKLQNAEIELVGLAGYQNLVAPDPSRRRRNIDYLIRCIELAPEFGTTVVATETGTRHPDSDWIADPANSSSETWNALYDALDELIPLAERHGVQIALEGYVNHVLGTMDDLQAILDRYDTPALQVVLDPFNYLSAELMPERDTVTRDFLARFENRFVIAHLKDVDERGAEADTPMLGQGVFPLPIYVEFLRDRRPDLPIIHEHLPFDSIPMASETFLEVARQLERSA
jgi:sugar phosphate isomerase/epimerase